MVSEPSSLRPAPTEFTIADEERHYVRSGKSFKEMLKRIGTISNLKDFITKHFNLPHIQVSEGSNGGVVIDNLFDGVHDDLESQNHEAFDNLLKLMGWIEGRFELLMCSDLVAHQVHDESPRCYLLSDDDRSTEDKLEIDSSLKNGEEIVQLEIKDEPKVTVELSTLVSHQVLDEMPRALVSHEMKMWDRIAKIVDELPPISLDEEQLSLKSFKVSDLKVAKALLFVRKEFIGLIILLIEFPTQEEITMDHMRVICFDPGGGSLAPISDSLNLIYVVQESDDLWSIDEELLKLKSSLFRIIINQSDLFALGCDRVKENSIFQKWELKSNQALIDNVEMWIFDPGGKLLIRLAFELFAAIGKTYLSYVVFARCAFIMLLQLRFGHHFGRAEMLVFDPGGEVAVQNLQSIKVGDSEEVLALIKLFKSEEFEPILMWGFDEKGELLEVVKCSYIGFQLFVFDPGITFKEEWKSETELDVVDECLSQNLKLKAYMWMGISVANKETWNLALKRYLITVECWNCNLGTTLRCWKTCDYLSQFATSLVLGEHLTCALDEFNSTVNQLPKRKMVMLPNGQQEAIEGHFTAGVSGLVKVVGDHAIYEALPNTFAKLLLYYCYGVL